MSFKERFDSLLHGLGLRPDPRSVVQEFGSDLSRYLRSTPDVTRSDGQSWMGTIIGVQGNGFIIEFSDGITEWHEADVRYFDFFTTDLKSFKDVYNRKNSGDKESFTVIYEALRLKTIVE